MLLEGKRPRLLGDLVQVFGDDDPRRSDRTLLVACLLALGIPAAEAEYFHATCEMIRGGLVWKTIWSLRQESPDGRFKTPAMIQAWDNGTWLCQNPTHPLAIMRGGVTYEKAFAYTPKFTLEQLANIETPDTWIEAAIRNLVVLLRDMPMALQASRRIVRFGPEWAAFVPGCAPESRKTALLKHVEKNERHQSAIAA